jgi:hypothetical protein
MPKLSPEHRPLALPVPVNSRRCGLASAHSMVTVRVDNMPAGNATLASAGFWHPSRVLRVSGGCPGVSLRSTPGYFLSTLRVGAEFRNLNPRIPKIRKPKPEIRMPKAEIRMPN